MGTARTHPSIAVRPVGIAWRAHLRESTRLPLSIAPKRRTLDGRMRRVRLGRPVNDAKSCVVAGRGAAVGLGEKQSQAVGASMAPPKRRLRDA
jgi:hypothetical protein